MLIYISRIDENANYIKIKIMLSVILKALDLDVLANIIDN